MKIDQVSFLKARKAQKSADIANGDITPIIEIISALQEQVANMDIDISGLHLDVELANSNMILAINAKDETLLAIANAGMDYPKVSNKIKAEFFGINLF
jgi:hypothetical protein